MRIFLLYEDYYSLTGTKQASLQFWVSQQPLTYRNPDFTHFPPNCGTQTFWKNTNKHFWERNKLTSVHFPVENGQCLQGIIICGFKCCYFLCQGIGFILLASPLQANGLQHLWTQQRQLSETQFAFGNPLTPAGNSPTTPFPLQNSRFY